LYFKLWTHPTATEFRRTTPNVANTHCLQQVSTLAD
jgi:hypothetical protein